MSSSTPKNLRHFRLHEASPYLSLCSRRSAAILEQPSMVGNCSGLVRQGDLPSVAIDDSSRLSSVKNADWPENKQNRRRYGIRFCRRAGSWTSRSSVLGFCFWGFLIAKRCRRRWANAMSKPRDDRQNDPLLPALDQIIDMGHPPVRLAGLIDRSMLN